MMACFTLFSVFLTLIDLVNVNGQLSGSNFLCDTYGECQNEIIDCDPGSDCTVQCGFAFNEGCEGATINCPDNYKCHVQCGGGRACSVITINGNSASLLNITAMGNGMYNIRNSKVNCPNNGDCYIHCDSMFRGCESMNITAFNSNLMYLECKEYVECNLVTVYCPTSITNPCTLKGIRDTMMMPNMKIYANNGFSTVSIINSVSSIGTIYCNSNYSSQCVIDANNNLCQLPETVCNPPPSPNTSNPTTSVPTTAIPTTLNPTTAVPTTAIPTTSIPTNFPTIDPTFDPTADPTNHPTMDPTNNPSADPTKDPTIDPMMDSTVNPTSDPTTDPTKEPTQRQLYAVDHQTVSPTFSPTQTTSNDNIERNEEIIEKTEEPIGIILGISMAAMCLVGIGIGLFCGYIKKQHDMNKDNKIVVISIFEDEGKKNKRTTSTEQKVMVEMSNNKMISSENIAGNIFIDEFVVADDDDDDILDEMEGDNMDYDNNDDIYITSGGVDYMENNNNNNNDIDDDVLLEVNALNMTDGVEDDNDDNDDNDILDEIYKMQ